MAGRMVSAILIIMMFTFFVLLLATQFLHHKILVRVDTINYNVIESVATKGEFPQPIYDYLKERVAQQGDYIIKLKYEKEIKPGFYDTYYEEADIIGRKLEVGDRITIYLEDKDLTIFGRFINTCFLGMYPENFMDLRVKSINTTVVSKDGE